jgi:hypothetical protein
VRGRELTVRALNAKLALDCDVPAVARLLCDAFVLIRAHPVGDRRSGPHSYAPAGEWLPELDLTDPGDEADGLAEPVRACLHRYGPLSVGDVVGWTLTANLQRSRGCCGA